MKSETEIALDLMEKIYIPFADTRGPIVFYCGCENPIRRKTKNRKDKIYICDKHNEEFEKLRNKK